MRKLSLIIQEILKILLMFLLFYVWLRYALKKFWPATLLSLALSLSIWLFLWFLKRKKSNRLGLKLKEKEDAENMFLSLAFDENSSDFFCKLASKQHDNIEKHKDFITITYPQEKAKTLLWFERSFEGLTVSKIAEIYGKIKREKATKIVICCKDLAEKNISSFLGSFDEKILIFDEYETYQKLYKLYDFYPQITRKYGKEKKMAFKDFLAYSFNKKRAKGYLFSALILIISSLFVRMTIYYCIISSILIIFALISFFNPKFNTQDVDSL